MPLNLGIIELNNITLGKDTSIDEILVNPLFHSYVTNESLVNLFTAEQVVLDGYTFNVKVFFVNNKLSSIRMTPANLEMKDTGYPDKKYQEEKKKVADTFLLSELGCPLKESEAVLYYEFEWGSIASVAFLGGRNEYTGGFIEISYKN